MPSQESEVSQAEAPGFIIDDEAGGFRLTWLGFAQRLLADNGEQELWRPQEALLLDDGSGTSCGCQV